MRFGRSAKSPQSGRNRNSRYLPQRARKLINPLFDDVRLPIKVGARLGLVQHETQRGDHRAKRYRLSRGRRGFSAEVLVRLLGRIGTAKTMGKKIAGEVGCKLRD